MSGALRARPHVYLHFVGRDNFTFTLPAGQEVTEVCRKVLHDEFHNFVLF